MEGPDGGPEGVQMEVQKGSRWGSSRGPKGVQKESRWGSRRRPVGVPDGGVHVLY